MAWQFSLYQLPPSLAALISLVLVASVWDHRHTPMGTAFVVFVAALFEWSLLYTLQLGVTDLATKLLIYKLQYIGAVTVPTMWLVLTARYAGRDDWLSRRTGALLALEPILTLLLLSTNPSHGLLYETAVLTTGPVPRLSFTFGLWYWINLTYSYLLVIYGLLLLVDVVIRGLQLYRRQATLLIAGAVVPLVANSLFAAGRSPVADIDLTTFAFAITGVVFAIGLFEFDLLTRTPIARRRMSEELGDGFVVVDDQDRIVNYNETAARIFEDRIDTDQPLATVFDVDDLDALDGTELTTTGDEQPAHYQVRCLPLDGRRDAAVGHLIALREITDQKVYEQRLEVANRLLRHNLRTDTNLILGHADNLADAVPDRHREDLEQIRIAAHRLADLSHKANQLETTLHLDAADRTTVDAVPVVGTVVDRVRTAHPAATITLDAPARAPVTTVNEALLEAAVGHVLENAIEHTDRPPEVTVTVESGDPVTIRVADNGPGIPDIEQSVIAAGRETQLEHGSGVGLWLVHWITTASGGDVAFDTNDPRGSVVTLTLPAG